MSTPLNKRISWTKLAEELGTDVRTLKANCKGIMRRIDAISVKKQGKCRFLWPKQVLIIKKHLGIQ